MLAPSEGDSLALKPAETELNEGEGKAVRHERGVSSRITGSGAGNREQMHS